MSTAVAPRPPKLRQTVLHRSAWRWPPSQGSEYGHDIDDDDLERFRELAAEFVSYDARQVGKLAEAGAWIEVECDGDHA